MYYPNGCSGYETRTHLAPGYEPGVLTRELNRYKTKGTGDESELPDLNQQQFFQEE